MYKIPKTNNRIKTTNGCIFVHIPRTAGNSISSATGCWSGHFLARWLKQILPDWDKLWTFSIIRNPWQQAVSWWSLCKKKRQIEKPFKKWVKDNNNPWKLEIDPIDQWEYLTEKSHIIVKHIGRFENLKQEWKLISEKLGCKGKPLPVKESTSHKNYRKYYDDETIEIIAKRNKKLLEKFKYTF